MKYLSAFLGKLSDSYPDPPAEPAKPQKDTPGSSSAGFAGPRLRVFSGSVVIEPEPTVEVASIPDRSVWRSVLATWPDPERLRWGLRANELCDTGLLWNEAEYQAFQELTTESVEPRP